MVSFRNLFCNFAFPLVIVCFFSQRSSGWHHLSKKIPALSFGAWFVLFVIFVFEKSVRFGSFCQTTPSINQAWSVLFSVVCNFLWSFLTQFVISSVGLSLFWYAGTSVWYYSSAHYEEREFFESLQGFYVLLSVSVFDRGESDTCFNLWMRFWYFRRAVKFFNIFII